MRRSPPLADQPLAALATGLPGAAAVFRRCGIRFCQDGARTLAEAVAASEVSLAAMLGALEDLDGSARRGAPAGAEALIAFILERHHARHRAELSDLIARAEALEAARPDAPRGLAEVLEGLRAGLEEHMLKEEMRVFPLMRAGRRDRLRGALALMRAEHEDHAGFLLRLEQVTRGFETPAEAGEAWEALYGDLERFVDDLVIHVFREERLLFPRYEGH